MKSDQHVLIAGGGMVGLSLALLLDRQLPSGVRITLVEGTALPSVPDTGAAYHPSFDARSTALSYSTASIYRRLGVWDVLRPGLAPIESIHVSRRARPGSTRLLAAEQGWDALGWVVENPCLGRTLLAAVRERPRIALRCPAQVTAATATPAGMAVALAGTPGGDGAGADETVACDLLVIADGAESRLREQLAFLTRRKRYGQAALIANLAFERDHEGCAYERFTDSGPLALLPLPPSTDARSRAALVWTLPPERAASLCAADAAVFTRELLDAFGYRLGRIERVGERATYPLMLTEAVEQARRGCVVLGNAAHALHPVAGQGFNLALRDAQVLADRLAGAVGSDRSLGDPAVLSAYTAQRQRDQARTIAASDGLPALFMHSDPVLALGRDLALAGLDMLPVLRRQFVQQAAGMAALESADG
ncbi:MAG: 2-octaprenyl-6-methoxyphenyl hydroxylase [Halieaceae bacterium]|nr:2-octaprenyl-6-methoxyphenyl hydroxylase [Halieaceae bacterium]